MYQTNCRRRLVGDCLVNLVVGVVAALIGCN